MSAAIPNGYDCTTFMGYDPGGTDTRPTILEKRADGTLRLITCSADNHPESTLTWNPPPPGPAPPRPLNRHERRVAARRARKGRP